MPSALRSSLLEAIGVSRVARVTGLDRLGVEVACAVRPRGHVLQVSNGKGETFAAAEQGALLEAAELWAAESIDSTRLLWAARRELSREAWDAADLGSAGRLVAPALWSEATRVAWKIGLELFSQGTAIVPAQALHCPPAGSPPLGPAVVAWTTNGMGAHPDREAALAHALLEAIERDQLARALPEGWTAEEIARRMLPAAVLAERAPRAAARLRSVAERRFSAYLFDLTPRARSTGLPVAGALLFDEDRGPVPLTAGYACGLDWDAALLGALLEAAQSRLTDIHGARDDVEPAEREAVEVACAACAAVRPRRRLAVAPRGGHPLEAILDGLARAGHRRAASFELAPVDVGLHVIKVVVPGLLVSELL